MRVFSFIEDLVFVLLGVRNTTMADWTAAQSQIRKIERRREKMKILLVTVAVLVAIEAKPYNPWDNVFNNPGLGNGRGNNYGQGPPWSYPLRQDYLQNIGIGLSSNVEWVCRNSKTNDMMIIAAENMPQTPNRGPWQWQNFPPGHHRHQQEGSYWTQPIIIIQQGNKDGNNEGDSPSPNTTPETHNNDNQPQTTSQTTPQYHGGEGEIDIRFGKNSF